METKPEFQMAVDVAPCPHCGKDVSDYVKTYTIANNPNIGLYGITACGCLYGNSRQSVIDRWNTRHISPEVKALVEAASQVYECSLCPRAEHYAELREALKPFKGE